MDLSILYFASCYGCHANSAKYSILYLVVLIVGPNISHTSIQSKVVVKIFNVSVDLSFC